VGAGTAAKVHHHTPAGDLQAGKRRRGTVCDFKQHQDAHTGTGQVRQGGVCRWGIGGGALVEKGDQMPHVIGGGLLLTYAIRFTPAGDLQLGGEGW
jgi:hypothetical protein